MKTLANHTLLYDEDCPMCNLYTAGFIKTKMLDSEGRKPFIDITASEEIYIDIEKAKDEIALVDNKNKKVFYGIESLLKVLGNSFPLIETVGSVKPVHFLLKKLYKLISYNRKVIVPSKSKIGNGIECVPTFNIKYRLFYILFATLFTAVILFQYSKMIAILPKATFMRELLLATGQIAFQYLFIQKLNTKKKLEYIGNLVTVSVIGIIILAPILILNQFLNINEYFILVWFGLTVNFMIYEHFRRNKILELPKHLTLTWILYRIIALIIILNL